MVMLAMTSTLLLGLVTPRQKQSSIYSIIVMLAMTSALLLGLVTSSSEATIYLFHNGHISDDFNLIAMLSNFLVRSNHLSIP